MGEQPPYDPRYQTQYVVRETHGKAIGALVAAILAWVACPIIPAFVALSWASTAEGEILAIPGRYTGLELTKIARVLAWVHLGAYAVGIVLFLVMVSVSAASLPSY